MKRFLTLALIAFCALCLLAGCRIGGISASTPKSCTITFDHGEFSAATTDTASKGSRYVFKPTADCEGGAFVYYTVESANGTANYLPGDAITVYGDMTVKVVYKPYVYFSFLSGGEVVTRIRTHEGGRVVMPEFEWNSVPDHEFIGWSDGQTVYQAGQTIFEVSRACELSAVWQRVVFTATFERPDGTSFTKKCKTGEQLIFPDYGKPLEEDRQFAGWINGGRVFPEGSAITFDFEKDVTFTAKITGMPVDWTLDFGGLKDNRQITVTVDDTFVFPRAEEIDRAIFICYRISNGEKQTEYQPGDSVYVEGYAPVTVYAVYKRIYTVRYDVLDAVVKAPSDRTVTEGTVIKLADGRDIYRSGAVFDGWLNGKTGDRYSSLDEFAVTADVTFTVIWRYTTFTVTFDCADGSQFTTRVDYKAELVMPVHQPEIGEDSVFAGWEYGGEIFATGQTVYYDYTVGITFTAVVQKKQITVVFTGYDGEVYGEEVYSYGQTVAQPTAERYPSIAFLFDIEEFKGFDVEGALLRAVDGRAFVYPLLLTPSGRKMELLPSETFDFYLKGDGTYSVSARAIDQNTGAISTDKHQSEAYAGFAESWRMLKQPAEVWSRYSGKPLYLPPYYKGKAVTSTADGYVTGLTSTEACGAFSSERVYPIGGTAADAVASEIVTPYVYIPSTYTSLGSASFKGMRGLTEVEYHPSVFNGYNNANITASLFEGCAMLEKFKLPQNTVSVGQAALKGCVKITATQAEFDGFTDELTALYARALLGTDMAAVLKLPQINTIGDGAFRGCGFTKVVIGANCRRIGSYAFYSNKKLAECSIPQGLTAIGEQAFGECDLLKR